MFAATSNGALAGSSAKLEVSYAASNTGSYHNVQDLQQLKVGGQNSPESVAEIGRQFESLLAHQMLKAMRSATNVWSKGGMFSSEQLDFYQQMMDDQLSLELTRGEGLGLAQQFVNEIAGKYQQDQSETVLAVENKPITGSQGFDLDIGGLLRANQKSPLNVEPNEQVSLASPAEQRVPTNAISITAQVNPVGQKENSPQHFSSPEDFVEAMRGPADTAAKSLGVATDVLLAQAALESGWGNKTIPNSDGKSSFNLFGIKADSRWQGEVAEVKTLEYFSGVPVKVNAQFRSYNSYAESFSDYVNFIQSNNRYQNVTSNPQQYPQALQQAGYATDPHYAEKIENIMQRLSRSSESQQSDFSQVDVKG